MAAYSVEVFLFITGVCFGSFINVLIIRLPLHNSIITPSCCPTCKKALKWYHNIPIFSYIALQGKCAYCQTAIDKQYIMVELIAGVLTLLLFQKLHFSSDFFVVLALFYLLLTLSLIDLKYKAVPDYLLLIALVLVFFVGEWSFLEQLKNATVFAGGFALLSFVVTFYIQNIKSRLLNDETLTKQTALGEGDIPIVAIIAALVGIKAGLVAIFLAALFAIMPAVYNSWVKKENETPFIPFLTLGLAIEYIFSLSKGF
ncbi:MAG: prepilin peptidase [Candidatus Marinarcus sp.]|uniref:prepilin peptidase n=1 Tax=Candidatus Marinarcus sp. TaxID=3100987 RepID=UPI003B008D1C